MLSRDLRNKLPDDILKKLLSVPKDIRESIAMLYMWEDERVTYKARMRLDAKHKRNDVGNFSAWLDTKNFDENQDTLNLLIDYDRDRRDREILNVDIDYITHFVCKYYHLKMNEND